MQVSRRDAVALLIGLGMKAAGDKDKYDNDRLAKFLNNLDEMVDEEPDFDNEKVENTYNEVKDAIDGGHKIEVTDDDSEDGGDEEPKSKKSKKKKENDVAKTKEKSKAGKDKTKPGKKAAGGQKKPGVIATIIECLEGASSKKPIKKEAILKVLTKKFPDRNPNSMKATVSAQVPTGLKAEKNITVKKTDEGYYIGK